MKTVSHMFTTVLLIALCLLGNRTVLATDWISVGGNVHFGEIPVCALVLINGQTQFSCDGTGRYDMEVPIDDNGMITVQVYADGFAPFSQIVTPDQAAAFPINMLLDQNSPTLDVVATYEHSATEGRFVVSGTIYIGTIPVCALVLANGQNMFSCNENFGQFSLDVPVDPEGNITLFVYAAGFKPYKLLKEVLRDSDQDGIKDYLDYDDDNDGIFDVDDICPLNAALDCKLITDTITANSKVWAQVSLFTNLSSDEINAVCPEPTGICIQGSTLNGYDMSGWKWADGQEVSALFQYYSPYNPRFPQYPDGREQVAEWMFADGWKVTRARSSGERITLGVTNNRCLSLGCPEPNAGLFWRAVIESYKVGGGPSNTYRWEGYVSINAIYLRPDERDPESGAWFFRSTLP